MRFTKLVLLLVILAFSLGILNVRTSLMAATDPFSAACDAIPAGQEKPSTWNTNSNDPISGKDKEGALVKAIQLVALAAGVISIVVVIIGGIEYITSGGDSTKVNNAKNVVLYAIIGLVIITLAQAIVVFVIKRINI